MASSYFRITQNWAITAIFQDLGPLAVIGSLTLLFLQAPVLWLRKSQQSRANIYTCNTVV